MSRDPRFHLPPALRRIATIAAMLALIGVSGCTTTDAEPAPDPDALVVAVSVLPQQYLLERIGGEHVNVLTMVGPGDEPHTYEPTPDQLRTLSSAAMYVTIGVDFETAWMDRIRAANTSMEIVDALEGLEQIAPSEDDTHDEHAHDEIDPHVWTSPTRMAAMGLTVTEALADIDPDNAEDYRANYDALARDIDELDTDIRTTLADVSDGAFLVFHPAWGYFADDYGLHQVPVQVGGQEPSAAELARVIDLAREEDVRVVFAQPTISSRSAQVIADEIDGEVLLIDPLAYDWLDNMRDVADTLARVLGG